MKNILNSKFSEKVKLDQSMKKYNTWGVGGLADVLYEPESINDLLNFLKLVKDERKFFIGNGSNILVRDKGLRGVVISLKKSLQKCITNDDNSLYVEAGYSCMKIAQYSAKNNLGGLEFLSGVPGTIGGALYMNAGCYGSEIWDFIDYVELINSNCELEKRRKCDFNINYRNVELNKNELFVAALTIPLMRNHDAGNKIKSYLEKRRKSQPTGAKTCGSVFKNPVGEFAGKIIEELGLLGYSIGGACISKKHGNFIENKNNATSKNIEDLIEYIQEFVKEKRGINLETDVKFIGEK